MGFSKRQKKSFSSWGYAVTIFSIYVLDSLDEAFAEEVFEVSVEVYVV